MAPFVISSKHSMSLSLVAMSSTAAAESTVPLMKVFLGRISSSEMSSFTLSADGTRREILIEEVVSRRLGQRREILAESLLEQLRHGGGVVARAAEELLRRRLELLVELPLLIAEARALLTHVDGRREHDGGRERREPARALAQHGEARAIDEGPAAEINLLRAATGRERDRRRERVRLGLVARGGRDVDAVLARIGERWTNGEEARGHAQLGLEERQQAAEPTRAARDDQRAHVRLGGGAEARERLAQLTHEGPERLAQHGVELRGERRRRGRARGQERGVSPLGLLGPLEVGVERLGDRLREVRATAQDRPRIERLAVANDADVRARVPEIEDGLAQRRRRRGLVVGGGRGRRRQQRAVDDGRGVNRARGRALGLERGDERRDVVALRGHGEHGRPLGRGADDEVIEDDVLERVHNLALELVAHDLIDLARVGER